MPKVRDASGPFHSGILPPRMTRMEGVEEVIPFVIHERSIHEGGKEVWSEASG